MPKHIARICSFVFEQTRGSLWSMGAWLKQFQIRQMDNQPNCCYAKTQIELGSSI